MIDPDVAGIGVGSGSHYVAVPADRAEMPVREFRSFTRNLYEVANWLAECRIKKVYVESPEVYWIALYDILAMRGFDVFLGERPAWEERVGTQVGRSGLPVAQAAGIVRAAEGGPSVLRARSWRFGRWCGRARTWCGTRATRSSSCRS